MSLQPPAQAGAFTISSELLHAYQSTDYVVETHSGVTTVRIGEPFDFDTCLPKKPKRLAVITAFNPYSQMLTAKENARRHLALMALVETARRHWLPAKGIDPSGQWPSEQSLAIQDPTDDELDDWMELFGQNAVVVASEGCPATLRLHPRAVKASIPAAGPGARG